ncbi:ferredoxin [Streptomyces roseicoloratus]|uniref:Ferredoxin n=1 Tax=Streptomyces roseicoloratus TaxID=2508722 RepID=A0ABY9RS94_9ACTN|nr:ferredoxin [Streptomyces roseicoloratus]WMX44599.1 ferredoxin [Streptomyces roseicoloratus]
MTPSRVSVERERCIGAGMCAVTAPEVFDQDPGDGLVILLDTDPTASRERAARTAAGVCPSGAITFREPGTAGS